jgi:hypothetical protein
LDKNNNNVISLDELDEFLKTTKCIDGQHFGAKIIMDTCDLNKDGILSIVDWSHHNACIHSNEIMNKACQFCEKC